MPLIKHTYILQKLLKPLLAFLTLATVVHFLLLTLKYEIRWEYALADALITNLVLAIVIGSVIQFLSFYRRNRNNFFYSGVVASIEAVIAGFIIIFILKSIHPDTAYVQFVRDSTPLRIILDLIICNGIVKAVLFFQRLEELTEVSARDLKSKETLREAELQKLQQQLQPHFLFNSLNSINALIITNPEEASVMVQKLSDFLRYTTKTSNEQWVTLADELKFLELYLDIEKVRFGHRLTVEKTIDEKCLNAEIPTLVLQPIVENAIKFGLYGTTEAVKISLNVSCTDKHTEIRVENPYDKDMMPQKGTGFGLNGLKRRLYLLYARNDLVTTHSENNHFTATLKIPLKK